MRKQHKLQNMVLLCFSALAIVLILIISLVVGTQYVDREMENCRNTAYAYTKSAAELIDGDKIAYYLETEDKDEYYYEILDFFICKWNIFLIDLLSSPSCGEYLLK